MNNERKKKLVASVVRIFETYIRYRKNDHIKKYFVEIIDNRVICKLIETQTLHPEKTNFFLPHIWPAN